MTETGEPALLGAAVLVVVQRPKFASSRAEYDIYAPDGTPYGSVHQQFGSGAGFLGQLATITYDVVGADGQLLMQLTKPGNIGRAYFEVVWGNGSPIGSIEQENLLFAPRFALTATDGTPYGSVQQQFGSGAGFLGQLATITYDVVGTDGQLLMQLTKPGNIGRAYFEVAWGDGSALGSIEQENLLFAPQFALSAVDGGSARLTGGAMMSWNWQLEDGSGQVVGSVSKEFAGLAELFSSADRFVVQLSPGLTGALRALAIVATVCLDEVRTAKRRR